MIRSGGLLAIACLGSLLAWTIAVATTGQVSGPPDLVLAIGEKLTAVALVVSALAWLKLL